MAISRPIGGAPPIAPEDPVRPHGYVPQSSAALPSSPPNAKKTKPGDKPPAPQDLWTFAYQGTSGGDLTSAAFPVIELPKPKPLTFQFYQDTALRAPEQTSVNTICAIQTFDNPQVEADPGNNTFRLIDQGGGSFLLLLGTQTAHGLPPVESVPDLLTAQKLQITLPTPVPGSAFMYSIDSVDTTDPEFVRLYLQLDYSSPVDADPIADGLLCSFMLITSTPPEPPIPNAGVRARITYTAGRAEALQFECDWSGALQLMASRVLLERVTVRTDGAISAQAQPIKIAAVVLADGDRPATLPTLTELTEAVPTDETYTLLVPSFARRVSLLVLYGNEGAPGDAPLGELFVAFVSAAGNAIAYIDAMSAREALFGSGLPIPNGTREIALSNRSDDASVRLGVVWHLGV